MKRLFILFAVSGIAALTSPFTAAPAWSADVEIIGAWARAAPDRAVNGAAYVTLTNAGASEDRLIAVETAAAGRAEIHTHGMAGGIMKMQRLDFVAVPAGDTVTFQPGGLHLMLFGLQRPLKVGETISLTLIFAKAGRITVTAPVLKRAPEKGPMKDMGGEMGMDHSQHMQAPDHQKMHREHMQDPARRMEHLEHMRQLEGVAK